MEYGLAAFNHERQGGGSRKTGREREREHYLCVGHKHV